MNKHLLRKMKSALIASFLLPVLMGIYTIFEGDLTDNSSFLIIVFFFAVAGNFLYGIPVSFLVDSITIKVTKLQFLLSGFLHIIFAFISFVIIEGFNTFAIICAALFFLSEEWQKGIKQNFNWKQMIVKCIFVVGFTVLAVYSSFYMQKLLEKKTNEYYLIPSGYVGEVTVIYDIKDESKADKVGDYNVIKINADGYGLTALPEPEGTHNNKYFYVDDEGRREKIDKKCIHIGSSGSTSNDDREFYYSSFTVIDSNCTDHFSTYGSQYLEDHSIDVEEILQREGFEDFGF
ncbi:hypothetical protein P4V41_10510 [Fictibacillus nanhaiensis]|uniref:DUF6843 domain-containing protein n=1 Tax=Fictibacillus nanhaiensis TaxID=742169 RepID=UPI002E1C75B0|nr:hypothetical protein [Fictibacillus nanhaiensis]